MSARTGRHVSGAGELRAVARDVGEFLDWVKGVRLRFGFEKEPKGQGTDPWGPWFRGHEDASWSLCPKVFRTRQHGSRGRKLWRRENEIVEEFTARAPALSETLPVKNDVWAWWFLMQHFGVPTRLLDWTEGALVALFFATKDDSGRQDAAVWALDPYKLNRSVLRLRFDWVVSPCVPGVPKIDLNRINAWLPRQLRGEGERGGGEWDMRIRREEVIAVSPSHIARRIGTQRSCFTVHGSDPDYLDELAKQDKRQRYLSKITIPNHRAGPIRKELDGCGIDETSVFPDLDGLGRALRLKWLTPVPALPHKFAYTRLRPSSVHGVGVFALRRISRGTHLFPDDSAAMIWIGRDQLRDVPREIRRLYDDFAVLQNGRYGCPTSFNCLTMAWYLNEPDKGRRSNVRCDMETFEFYAKRDIEPGEELTVNYHEYSETSKSSVDLGDEEKE